MEWLQTILEKAEVKDGKLETEALLAAIKAEIPKHLVSKVDFNAKVEELKTANGTIATLKKENKDNEELQNTIKTHETTISNLQKEKADMKKTYALREALAKEGCSDPDYLIYKQGGLDKFTFDKDGSPIGVKEIVEPMKVENAVLFPQNKKEQHYNPAGGGAGGTNNPFLKDSFNLTEQGRIFKENPEQARAMAAAAGVEI